MRTSQRFEGNPVSKAIHSVRMAEEHGETIQIHSSSEEDIVGGDSSMSKTLDYSEIKRQFKSIKRTETKLNNKISRYLKANGTSEFGNSKFVVTSRFRDSTKDFQTTNNKVKEGPGDDKRKVTHSIDVSKIQNRRNISKGSSRRTSKNTNTKSSFRGIDFSKP